MLILSIRWSIHGSCYANQQTPTGNKSSQRCDLLTASQKKRPPATTGEQQFRNAYNRSKNKNPSPAMIHHVTPGVLSMSLSSHHHENVRAVKSVPIGTTAMAQDGTGQSLCKDTWTRQKPATKMRIGAKNIFGKSGLVSNPVPPRSQIDLNPTQ